MITELISRSFHTSSPTSCCWSIQVKNFCYINGSYKILQLDEYIFTFCCVHLTVWAALSEGTLSSSLQFTGLILTAGVLLTLLQHTHTHTHTVSVTVTATHWLHDNVYVWFLGFVLMKSLILEEAPDLLWSTVTLFSHVHQSVSTVGGAVGLVWPRDVQETRSPRQQDHLLKVISATAAEVHGSSAGVCGGTACVEQRWVDLSIGSELSHIWRCVCLYYRGVCVLRGSRVHDAGGGGAGAGASIVMVHPEVVAEFMSHDGGERRNVLIGELRRQTGVCVCVCVCVLMTASSVFSDGFQILFCLQSLIDNLCWKSRLEIQMLVLTAGLWTLHSDPWRSSVRLWVHWWQEGLITYSGHFEWRIFDYMSTNQDEKL